MIPEITITCSTGKVFINNVTVEQYKKYAALMEKNGSDKITDALFFNKRIIQEIFGNRMSLDELGEVDVIEFLTASKGIHFIMQDIVSDALLNIVETEPIEREASAFDEYDRENGYEDEEQEEQNTWKICGEIVDRVTKIAIRLMRESYGQCMKENIIELLKYLKFELEAMLGIEEVAMRRNGINVITKVIPGVTDDMLSAMNSTGIISGYMEVGRVYTGKNILKNHWPIISIIVAILISIVITVTR